MPAAHERPFRFEVRAPLPFPLDDAVRVAEAAATEVAESLGVELGGPHPVVLGPDASGTAGGTLILQVMPDRGGLAPLDWFELLLRHELTHALIAQRWGTPGPVLFWEGLPVHLGDDRVRERVLGRSYAEHCRALLAAERLVPLSDLLLPSAYYARRTDWRIDLQAGAFAGWWLQRGRLDELRRIYRAWRAPTPARPRIELGFDLEAEEAAFRAHLAGEEPDAELVQRYRGLSPPPPGRPHCDFCMHPRRSGPCPGCGAEPVPVRVIG